MILQTGYFHHTYIIYHSAMILQISDYHDGYAAHRPTLFLPILFSSRSFLWYF